MHWCVVLITAVLTHTLRLLWEAPPALAPVPVQEER